MVQVDYEDNESWFGANEGSTVQQLLESCRSWNMPETVVAYLNDELVTDWETFLMDGDILSFMKPG